MSLNAPARGAPETQVERLNCGTSPHFWNKENRAPYTRLCKKHTAIAQDAEAKAAKLEGRAECTLPDVYDTCWAFSRFPKATLPVTVFIDRILNGMAWIPSVFVGYGRRTNANWQSAELIAIDYDRNVSVADCLAVPFIRQHALLVHPSASSGTRDANGQPIYKTRVIFWLDSPISGNLENYRRAVIGLCRLLGLPDDACSYKPAQLFYGSTNRIETPHVNLSARLPLATITPILEQLQREAAEKIEREQHAREALNYQPVERTSQRAQSKIDRVLDRAEQNLARVTDDRTTAAYNAGNHLGRYIPNWDLSDARVEAALLSASEANGSLSKYGETEMLRHIRNGIAAGKLSPEPRELPAQRPASPPVHLAVVPNFAQRERATAHAEPEPPIQPLTLWQYGRYMCVCPEYVLTHILTVHDGCAEDFTTDLLAELVWKSPTTVQKWIDKAVTLGLISELTANFPGIEGGNTIPRKNAVNSKRGPKAVHYRLTPHLAEPYIAAHLWEYVHELMQAPDPGVIRASDALAAGVAEAEALEQVSAAIASTEDAAEVSINAERTAVRIARWIERQAERDRTRFATDELPCSVRELRTMLIDALIATDPKRVWKQSELMWIAGTTKSNVSKLIAKSNKFAPAPSPTFVTVSFDGKKPHAAMQAACRAQHGAPAAWIDANGEIISGFSRNVPSGAVGGLINVGKVYVRRAAASSPAPTAKQPEKTIHEPTEEAKQKAAQRQARSLILPLMRGCLVARAWRLIPGAYGYWERSKPTNPTEFEQVPNTFDGMVEALLRDRDWARQLFEPAQGAAA